MTFSNDNQKNQIFVIFGASGDLAHKKIYPALYKLFQAKILGKGTIIVGYARSSIEPIQFRKSLNVPLPDDEVFSVFLESCFYVSEAYNSPHDMKRIIECVGVSKWSDASFEKNFYLSIPPTVFEDTLASIHDALYVPGHKNRIAIEKPFGNDLESCRMVEQALERIPTKDTYRIDHYLGKRTVRGMNMIHQNPLFAGIWNSDHIYQIDIVLYEKDGVGTRAGFYDKAGVLRDVFQNHILQVVALLACDEHAKVRTLFIFF